MSTPKIDTSAVMALATERAPLWLRYPTQAEAQPAHLVMDADGIVTARIYTEIGGGMPMDIAMGRRLCWRIPRTLTGEQLWPAGVELARAVAELEGIAEADGVILDGDLAQVLQARRSAQEVAA